MKKVLFLIMLSFSGLAQQVVVTDATTVQQILHKNLEENIDIKIINPSVFSVWLHTEGHELLGKHIEKMHEQTYILNKDCPNKSDMNQICNYVRNKEEDRSPSKDYRYQYQRTVYEAACVNYDNDSDEEISRKVRAMWELYGKNEKCGPMDTQSTGDPLKFAIRYYFNDFIEEALIMWKLDLNRLDADGTYLDYIDIQINKSNGEVQDRLKSYQRLFINCGAKRKSEL